MSKKMLIDSANAEEVRVCLLDNETVEDFDFEFATRKPLRGNIYLARVTRVEPSLQAAFVEYGGNRHGFLAFNEIHPDYYQIPVADRERLQAAEAEEARLADLLNLHEDADEDDLQGERHSNNDGFDEDEGEKNRRPKRRRRKRGESTEAASDDASNDETEPNPESGPEEGVADENITNQEPEIVSDSETSDDASETPETDGEAAADETSLEAKEEATDSTEASSETDDDDPSLKRSATDEEEEEEEENEEDEAVSSDRSASEVDTPVEDEVDEEGGNATFATDDAPVLKTSGDAEETDLEGEAEEEASSDDESDFDDEDTAYDDDDFDDADIDEEAYEIEDLSASSDDDAETNDTDEDTSEGDDDVDASADAVEDDIDETTPEGESRAELLEQYREARRARMRLLRNYKIQEVVKRRQILLIQVVKEERGNKGAALTTYMSLAGRYCVLMPNTARGGGISRKIANGSDRKRLRRVVDSLEVPKGMGLIIRTAGAKRTKAEIKRDYDYLSRLWENIRSLTLKSIAPCLIYEEANLIKRAIRDIYDKDISAVLVQGEDGYRQAKDFMKMLMPSHAKNVQPYREQTPIFLRHGVEEQLDAMYQPVVRLRSGGYLVINQTEALIAVDVNSGKATRERNIEQTALKTNLEAAREVARQCRLRDLAGLLVIDFIDMEEHRNNRAVEKRLKESLRQDRARIQVGRISPFGLLEMSRQRRRSGIVDGTTTTCPTCNGAGVVRSHEMAALRILRAAEAEVLASKASGIKIAAATDVVLYILNHKRNWLNRIETSYGVTLAFSLDSDKIGDVFELERLAGQRAPVTNANAIQSDFSENETDDEDDDAVTERRTEESDSDEDSEDGRGRKRRRRRRRRRGEERADDRQEDPRDGVSADDAGQDDDQDGEETNESRGESDETTAESDEDRPRRRRRRGRRGGRRNNRRNEEDTSEEVAAQSDSSKEDGVDSSDADNLTPDDIATNTESASSESKAAANETQMVEREDAELLTKNEQAAVTQDEQPASEKEDEDVLVLRSRAKSYEEETAQAAADKDGAENIDAQDQKSGQADAEKAAASDDNDAPSAPEKKDKRKQKSRKGWWQRALGG
ncbi:MAG: Rne/Rng family ribonuclease [Pseudomonadota bacterium]